MTNFEKITQSPESLVEFLLGSECAVARYEDTFELHPEIVIGLPYYQRTGDALMDVLEWLEMEAGEKHESQTTHL